MRLVIPAINEHTRPPPPPLSIINARFAARSAEVRQGACPSGLPIASVYSEDNVGDTGGASCPPPPSSKEVGSRARDEQEPIFDKEPCPVMSTVGSPSEPARRPECSIAFPVAMRESDLPSPAGPNASTTQRQQSEFYFNLGRRMLLDSIE